jgi:hypothetical protein
VPRKASLVLSLVIMALSGYGVFMATAWPWKAALFPLAIGIPLFCLAAGEALWSLFGSAGESNEAAISREALRRTAGAIAWMLGFFAAIVLLGFPIAVPLFMMLYLRLQGREAWRLSIVMTLAVSAVFYLLFERLLHLPFPSGWLFDWFAS